VSLLEYSLTSAGERRTVLTPSDVAGAPAIPMPRLPTISTPAQRDALRLVCSKRAGGPALAYRPSVASVGGGLGLRFPVVATAAANFALTNLTNLTNFGGEAWALRDSSGRPSCALIGRAGAAMGSGEQSGELGHLMTPDCLLSTSDDP
jgi:hypothetical protein